VDARDGFWAADQETPLEPDDLELLARAEFLTGREDECVDVWVRAHHEHLRRDDQVRAAGCATWAAFNLSNRGEFARAGGWMARAGELLDAADVDCAQRGYLTMLGAIQLLWRGEIEASLPMIREAREIAARFDEPDLGVLSRLGQGQALIASGQPADGLALLDEAMVAVTAGETSAVVSGLAYCAVISACHDLWDMRRAKEWSVALSHWCDDQPDLVPYSGWCLVHRAQIMQLHGEWTDAAEAAARAYERSQLSTDNATAGEAHYLLAELNRVRGRFAEAERDYREASRHGREPQPGLAMLRLAQGQFDVAASTIRRLAAEPTPSEPGRCAEILGAQVEIMLATGDVDTARSAAEKIAVLADEVGAPALRHAAGYAAGAVQLADGEPKSALTDLRSAWVGWQRLGAPYEAARARLLIGLACRELGDEDTAQMELDAARWTFLQLTSEPDLAKVEGLIGIRPEIDTCGLTARELEVLRHLASGKTNRAIASELVLSEKTVARHISNIFTKLGLTSRAAATAYAYEHNLV